MNDESNPQLLSPKTFADAPYYAALDQLDANIAILGAPCATPYDAENVGCCKAPAAIRRGLRGHAKRIGDHFDFDFPHQAPSTAAIADCGDLDCDPNRPERNRTLIRDAVATILGRNATPFVLGGDDSIPIPFFAAFEAYGPITIVQIDAHIDWRDEVHGERYGLSSNMRRASEMPWVNQLIQIGARGIGSARPVDYNDAKTWGADFIFGRDIAKSGVAGLDDLIAPGANVVIALDVDVLDPAVMPAVNSPSPGGLSYWDVVEILERVAAGARIVGFDIAEFESRKDTTGLAALVAGRITAYAAQLIHPSNGSTQRKRE